MKSRDEKIKNKNQSQSQENNPVIVLWIGAAIAGVASIVGALISANQTKKANEANINNQNEMWEKTNAYNHPLEQRMRLEKAGFNPNLMAGAPQNTAQNQNMPDLKVPDYTGISTAGQVAMQQFNQDRKTTSDILVNDQKIDEGISKTDLNKEQLDIMRQSKNDVLQIKKQQLNGILMDNANKEIQNSILSAKQKYTAQTELAKLNNIKQQGKNLFEQGQILEIQRKMWQDGVNPNDPLIIRALQMYGRKFIDFWEESWNNSVHPMMKFRLNQMFKN